MVRLLYVRTNIASGSDNCTNLRTSFTIKNWTEMWLPQGYSVTSLYLVTQGIPENFHHEVWHSRGKWQSMYHCMLIAGFCLASIASLTADSLLISPSTKDNTYPLSWHSEILKVFVFVRFQVAHQVVVGPVYMSFVASIFRAPKSGVSPSSTSSSRESL